MKKTGKIGKVREKAGDMGISPGDTTVFNW